MPSSVTSRETETETCLLESARRFPTRLWNDSAAVSELTRSIGFGAVGATCNPVIAVAVVKADLPRWRSRIAELAEERPHASESDLAWQIVEELSIESAKLLMPAFIESGGRDGRLSIQTDPRLHRDPEALVRQAVRFSQLAENIIVKIPATSAGIRAIEEATALGVSVNATVSFSVSQAVAVAEAIERGLDRRGPGTELGSVVTIMGGRLDDWLKHCAQRDRILIDPGALEWAGVAALKHAYQLFTERGYRSRLLSAAFRNHYQWSELQGGDLVVSPPFDWQLRIAENELPVENRIDVPVDPEIIETLRARLPDFRRAYDVDGMSVAEFETFGPTVRTLRQFLEADEALERIVRDVLLPVS